MYMIQNAYKMYTIQLRNLPEELYTEIKKAAESSRRSITQEVIFMIEENIAARKINEHKRKAKIKAMEEIGDIRPYFKGIDQDQIISMVREDRDR